MGDYCVGKPFNNQGRKTYDFQTEKLFVRLQFNDLQIGQLIY